MTDLLIQNGTILSMDAGGEVLPGGAVAVRDGRIAAVGKPADLKRMGFGEGRTLNARGQVVMPGLVNAHAHVAGGLLKALPEGPGTRAAMQRVSRLLFTEADPAETEALARASFLEALKSGVTCVGVLDRGASALRGAARESDGDGRVTARLGVHSPAVCSDETLESVAREAEARKLGLHFHLATFAGETETLRARAGGDLFGFLRRLDLLRSNTLAAGGCALKEEEIGGLRESAAQLAVASRADAARGVRTPVAACLRNKVPLVLGTNGIGHDLFAVMRAFILSARLDGESGGLVGPAEALRMATRDGARALGLLGSVGSIEIGKKADLILVTLDPAKAPLVESDDPAAAVAEVCGPGDVTDVVVDGEVLMEGGKVKSVDEKAVLNEARKAAAAAFRRVAN